MSASTELIALPTSRYSALRPFVPDTAWTTTPLHALERKTGIVHVDDDGSPSVMVVRISGKSEEAGEQVWIFATPSAIHSAGRSEAESGASDLDEDGLHGEGEHGVRAGAAAAHAEDGGGDAPGATGPTGPLATVIAALAPPTEVVCNDWMGHLVARYHPFAVPADHSVVWFDDIEAPLELDRVDGLRRLRLSDAADVEDLGIPGLQRTYETTKELLMAGGGYGVVVDNDVVCAAVTVDTSVNHARLAVATRPEYRRRGFATACMRRLVKAHHSQGRLTCATIPNRGAAGEMVARRVGFQRAARLRTYTLREA